MGDDMSPVSGLMKSPGRLANPSARESELLIGSTQRLLSLAERYLNRPGRTEVLPPRRGRDKGAASVYGEIGLVIAGRGFDVCAGGLRRVTEKASGRLPSAAV